MGLAAHLWHRKKAVINGTVWLMVQESGPYIALQAKAGAEVMVKEKNESL